MSQYTIKKVDIDNVPVGSELWEKAEVALIDKYPWTKEYPYVPNTTAKLLYSQNGISCLLETDETDLRATFTKPNDPVCQDSCMEFFFQPDKNDDRYLNFEINPFATLYLGLGGDRHSSKKQLSDPSTFDIISRIEGGKWQLKLYIPFDFIRTHFKEVSNPFKGNFYKCGDHTGHAHYGSWAEVRLPSPDFHRPEFFGEIRFE